MSYHVARFAKPKEEVCGTCKWHCFESTDEWICDNELSDNYMGYTEYGDSCSDYEERDK